jgi:alkylation response protein AidB-like acyl-CoA dehydrogenase
MVEAALTEESVRKALSGLLKVRTPETRLTTMGAGSDDLEDGRNYLQSTAEYGWHVPSWPSHFGGRDADSRENALIGRVLKEFIVPDLYPFAIGLGMVGPTLLAHGTFDQKSNWLQLIASGQDIWCQMFSEPDAGSDLANVGMSAIKDGDEWLLTGQKTWTSRAMWANWGICLARTDPSMPKHKGLTMFAIPMDASGVDVRPLTQMNKDAHFSEVFIDEARVSDALRIGDVGEGWRVAMTVLSHERAGGGSRGGGEGTNRGSFVPNWISDLKTFGVLDVPVARQHLMEVHCHDLASKFTSQRASDEARSSGAPGAAGSGAKLRTVRSYKERAYGSNRLAGPNAMLTDGHGYIETMTAPSMSIRGGTDEIQRNILGERVLGLPGEPRLDKTASWNESRKGLL